MSSPPFTMSKYTTELELQRDARKFYQEQSEHFEAALREIVDYGGWLTSEGLQGVAKEALTKYDK